MADVTATRRCLPMTRGEMKRRGWGSLDILLVTGDAYIDHPASGAALLGRWLESHGYRVGIVAQPRWDRAVDLEVMGRPRLFAGVTAGALDSMLARYTAFRRRRRDDAYTPGGRAGARPNRACIVYTGLVRRAFPGLPVILGGVEASLRRAGHFDFWTDKIRRSILLDSKADLVVNGMAERAILEVADRLDAAGGDRGAPNYPGKPLRRETRQLLEGIRGTTSVARRGDPDPPEAEIVALPDQEQLVADPAQLLRASLAMERQVHNAVAWATQVSGDRKLIFAPSARPLTTGELDGLYGLPFTRAPHPAYRDPIPAMEMIQFSVTTHRGCAGGCSFCSLALHQGRRVCSRSAGSITREVAALTRHPAWRGSVSDVGGPSANQWGARCAADPARCERVSCLHPARCPSFEAPQEELAALLETLDRTRGVAHVRVASGVRHDLALDSPAYLRTLIGRFTGGQLKLAPEHCAGRVLRLMRKPPITRLEEFLPVFEQESRRAGREQYVIPYLMSAFPGCTDDDMRRLARWLGARGWRPRQVQCFVPTPGTVAAAMFHAGRDPSGAPIHVARTDAARRRQHEILLRHA